MEANKWITDKTFAYTLHETGRFVKGEPELCNKFYFRVYPNYAHGITDEDAAKVVSELISAKEEQGSLSEQLEKSKSILQSVFFMFDNYEEGTIGKRLSNEAKELLNNIKK